MAFAYFLGHAPRGLFPIQNGGNLAILYCFVFFYLFFAGAGSWSLDALLGRRHETKIRRVTRNPASATAHMGV